MTKEDLYTWISEDVALSDEVVQECRPCIVAQWLYTYQQAPQLVSLLTQLTIATYYALIVKAIIRQYTSYEWYIAAMQMILLHWLQRLQCI